MFRIFSEKFYVNSVSRPWPKAYKILNRNHHINHPVDTHPYICICCFWCDQRVNIKLTIAIQILSLSSGFPVCIAYKFVFTLTQTHTHTYTQMCIGYICCSLEAKISIYLLSSLPPQGAISAICCIYSLIFDGYYDGLIFNYGIYVEITVCSGMNVIPRFYGLTLTCIVCMWVFMCVCMNGGSFHSAAQLTVSSHKSYRLLSSVAGDIVNNQISISLPRPVDSQVFHVGVVAVTSPIDDYLVGGSLVRLLILLLLFLQFIYTFFVFFSLFCCFGVGKMLN